jgi:hypothetical protein
VCSSDLERITRESEERHERDRKEDRAEQERITRESEERHERDRKEDRAEQERIRRETEERHERNRKEDRESMERWERNRKEDSERLEQLIRKFKEDVEKIRESLSDECEGRANKLAGDISKLESKTENSIVVEVQSQQVSEASVSHTAIVTELTEYKQGVENSLRVFQTEPNEFKNNVTAEGLMMGDKLDVAGRDNSSELGKMDDRLDMLEGRVAAAAGPAFLPSASAGIQVNGTTDRVQAGLAFANIGTDGSRHSVDRCGEQGEREGVGALPSHSDTYNNCNNDIIVKVAGQETSQFMHDQAKDIGLPLEKGRKGDLKPGSSARNRANLSDSFTKNNVGNSDKGHERVSSRNGRGRHDKQGRLQYRRNEFLIAAATVVILGILRHFRFPVTIIVDKYIQFLVNGLLYGIALAILLCIRGGRAHTMTQNSFAMSGSHIYDFWMSREVNPRIGSINVKVGLYRVGMVEVILVNAALVRKSVERNHGYHPLFHLLPGCKFGGRF